MMKRLKAAAVAATLGFFALDVTPFPQRPMSRTGSA